MQLPLRLQLRTSRFCFGFLAGGHILAGVAVCFSSGALWLRALLVLTLVLHFIHVWRRVSRFLPSLLLRRDGKLEVLVRADDEPAAPRLAYVGGDTVVWPWLVVLHLHLEGGERLPLLVFPDAITAQDGHRQLRVWLRWRASLTETGDAFDSR